MLGDDWMTAVILAVIAAISGGLGAWWTRQSKREETHLAQWKALTESQQKQIDSLDTRLTNAVADVSRQEQTIGEIKRENRRISRLLDSAVATLRGWIAWERSGRTGTPPQVPDDLRDLI